MSVARDTSVVLNERWCGCGRVLLLTSAEYKLSKKRVKLAVNGHQRGLMHGRVQAVVAPVEWIRDRWAQHVV